MRYLTVLFAAFILAACSKVPVPRSHSQAASATQALAPELQKATVDSVVQLTFSFQAPAFCAKHGFEVAATVDDHPHGHQNLLLRKHLGEAF